MSLKTPSAKPVDSERDLEDDLRLIVVRTVEGIPAVRDAWLGMQADRITVDPDYFLAALRSDPKIVRPHVMLLERGGEPEVMVVARIEQLELTHRLGYRTLYRPRVRSITIVYGGILGDPDERTFRVLLGELRRALGDGEADVVIFRYLPVDSPLYRQAASEPTVLSRQHVAQTGIHWELTLPDSLEELLQSYSAKTRQTLRRRRNAIRRRFGEALEMRVYTEESQIDEFFQAVETVAAKTYQHALGVAFGDTVGHRERTRLALERGWFRGYVLYLESEPAAFWHGDLYRGRFRTGNPGYDPKYADLSIGTFLLMEVIDDLCRGNDAVVLDHGLGDADYKRRFGTTSWEEGNVLIFAATLRGMRINLTRTAMLWGIAAVKAVAKRHGIFSAVKRRARASLSRRASPPGL